VEDDRSYRAVPLNALSHGFEMTTVSHAVFLTVLTDRDCQGEALPLGTPSLPG
jgi:hypothetical protein